MSEVNLIPKDLKPIPGADMSKLEPAARAHFAMLIALGVKSGGLIDRAAFARLYHDRLLVLDEAVHV